MFFQWLRENHDVSIVNRNEVEFTAAWNRHDGWDAVCSRDVLHSQRHIQAGDSREVAIWSTCVEIRGQRSTQQERTTA